MPKKQIEKLDDFSKILLATGQINYLSSCVNGVNNNIKQLPDPNGWYIEGIKTRDCLLRDVREGLYILMEHLADYMNDSDCISPIDVRVSKVAFNIVSGNNDDVSK